MNRDWAAFVDEEVRRTEGRVAFSQLYRRIDPLSDFELAGVIEADGRARLDINCPVALEDYLAAITDLPARRVPFDAAIDMALRSAAGAAQPDDNAVRDLVRRHPAHETAIRDAAMIGQVLWSTQTVREGRASEDLQLPADFGPVGDDERSRYRLISRLGRGSFGDVFLAEDRQLADDDHTPLVAIKRLAGAASSEWGRRRFAEEATKARRVVHPNVVRVLDKGVSQGEEYIVYDYVEGGTLESLMLKRGRLPAREAAAVIARIARGVQAIHSNELAHCDLKPANILIDADGVPKVTDFGVAMRTRDASRGRPRDNDKPVGTLAFMAPEQYRMEPRALGPLADVYALGGMLFWLVSGRLPNGETPEEIGRTHDPETGRSEPPQLGEAQSTLRKICARATHPDPAQRYTAAAELAADLEAWLDDRPIRWTRPSPARIAMLFAVRRPVVTFLLVATIATIIGATVTTFVLQARRLDDLARLQGERERSTDMATEAQTMLVHQLGRMRESGSPSIIAPRAMYTFWFLEGLYQLESGDPVNVLGEFRHRRDSIMSSYLASFRRHGDELSIDILQFEALRAFWLIEEGDYAIAEPLLLDNAARWRRATRSDEPWIDVIEILLACAAVNRFEEASRSERPINPDEAQWAADVLCHRPAHLAGRFSDYAPILKLALTKQHRLHAPDLLDNPARRAEAAHRHNTILRSDYSELDTSKFIPIEDPPTTQDSAQAPPDATPSTKADADPR